MHIAILISTLIRISSMSSPHIYSHLLKPTAHIYVHINIYIYMYIVKYIANYNDDVCGSDASLTLLQYKVEPILVQVHARNWQHCTYICIHICICVWVYNVQVVGISKYIQKMRASVNESVVCSCIYTYTYLHTLHIKVTCLGSCYRTCFRRPVIACIIHAPHGYKSDFYHQPL